MGGGVFPIYYNITIGEEGSLGTPNLYYVIYGRPLKELQPEFGELKGRGDYFRQWLTILPEPKKYTIGSRDSRGKFHVCIELMMSQFSYAQRRRRQTMITSMKFLLNNQWKNLTDFLTKVNTKFLRGWRLFYFRCWPSQKILKTLVQLLICFSL